MIMTANIPKYYIYDTLNAPAELVILHPLAAVYSTITLFVTCAANPPAVLDLASLGFNHPYNEDDTGLTAEQLNAMVDGLLSPTPPPTADEVWISKVQADYLYETRFKPVYETEI
jgi:hypothetical protein